MEKPKPTSPEDAYDNIENLTPIREHEELGSAQQLVIDGFWKAVEERRA